VHDQGGEFRYTKRGYRMTIEHTPSLRRVLEEAAAEHHLSMKDLTVLAAQNDPFRLDTPAGHRDGAWLAMIARDLGYGTRKVHLRGLHYAITTHPEPIFKPNGERYVNDDPNWLWMQGTAAKAARWLGYLDFDQIVDQRNTPPVVRIYRPSDPQGYLTVGVDVDIPAADEFTPTVAIDGFTGDQPYKLVLVGGKPRWRRRSPRSPPSTRPTCTCQPGRSATRSSTRWPGSAPKTAVP
jgi:hypothetical protein